MELWICNPHLTVFPIQFYSSNNVATLFMQKNKSSALYRANFIGNRASIFIY